MNKEDLKYLLLNFTNNKKDIEKNVEKIYNKYYSRRQNFQSYQESKKKLAQLIIEGNFPNAKDWNIIATKEGFYSSNSIKFIEECSWKEIEKKITQEIKRLLKT